MTRMDRTDDFALTVSAWLHEDARHHAPDDLDAVLRRTRTERQRPAWSSLERWLPMDIVASRTAFDRPAYVRGLALLIVLALLIAAVVRRAEQARGRPLPAPFGLAQNGAVVVERRWRHPCARPEDGHDLAAHRGRVVRLRPDLLARRHEVPVPPRPRRSPTWIPACRSSSPTPTAAAARPVTPLVRGLDWLDWSPDGARSPSCRGQSGDGTAAVINVVNVDGTGAPTLDVGSRPSSPRGFRRMARRSSSAASVSSRAIRHRGSGPCARMGPGFARCRPGRLSTTMTTASLAVSPRWHARRLHRLAHPIAAAASMSWTCASGTDRVLPGGRRCPRRTADWTGVLARRHVHRVSAGQPPTQTKADSSRSSWRPPMAAERGPPSGRSGHWARMDPRSTTTSSPRTGTRSSPTTTTSK